METETRERTFKVGTIEPSDVDTDSIFEDGDSRGFAMDTAGSWEGSFPSPRSGDYVVQIGTIEGDYVVLVSSRYTAAVDAESAAELALDAVRERSGWPSDDDDGNLLPVTVGEESGIPAWVTEVNAVVAERRFCVLCGESFVEDADGTPNHVDEDGDIDHDADEDHDAEESEDAPADPQEPAWLAQWDDGELTWDELTPAQMVVVHEREGVPLDDAEDPEVAPSPERVAKATEAKRLLAAEAEWVLFMKRTEEPKLSWIERELDRAGIEHRRHGESFHAPIVQVRKANYERAWAILTPVDNLDDDDPMFGVVLGGEAAYLDALAEDAAWVPPKLDPDSNNTTNIGDFGRFTDVEVDWYDDPANGLSVPAVATGKLAGGGTMSARIDKFCELAGESREKLIELLNKAWADAHEVMEEQQRSPR